MQAIIAYMCIEISMSAPNRYLVQLHGWPRAVTNVRIGDKFVYVGPVDGHVLYSGAEEPCPPGTILTVTDTQQVSVHGTGSGPAKLCYQLSAGTYDHELECYSFERWMYAKVLARMINRCDSSGTTQLRKVPKVSQRSAAFRRNSPFAQEYLHKFFKKITMPEKDETFKCVLVDVSPSGNTRLVMQNIDDHSKTLVISMRRLNDEFELTSIATGNPYCVDM